MARTTTFWTRLFAAFATLLLIVTAETADTQPAVEQVNGRDAVAHEILVKFRSGSPPGEIRSLANAASLHAIGRAQGWRLRSRSLNVQELLSRFANRPDIEYVEPNYIVHAFTEPTDPGFPQLWGLKNVAQAVNGGVHGTAGADIHATAAWDVSLGTTAHVVAVVDTGIDYTHPDLAANIWSAPATFTVNIGGTPITCPAGTHGFNALTLTCDPMDDNEHGTHVSGTIAASGGNGVGVVGVNWIGRLMGIKFLDSTGSGSEADAINGIEFAIQTRQAFAATGEADVRVLSNSWGGLDFSQALLDEIRAVNDANMIFVAAAGNFGISNDLLPTYPASYDVSSIVAVAATDNTDARASFSNYSPTLVHLGAPGTDILSTIPGSSYAFLSGTSMATPHVSGAAALVLSRCALDTAALKDTLLSTVDPVPALASITVSGGRLNVNSAIRSCVSAPATPSGLSAAPGDGQVALAWASAVGALAYNVKRSVTSGGPYTMLASGVKGAHYLDTAVTNGTTYYYVVSATNTLGESGNSGEASATPKTASDLTVSALTVPLNGGAGSTLTVSVTISNQGPGASNQTTTRFYLSRSATIDVNAVALDAVQPVPVLSAGTSATASLTATIPNVATGSYYVIAKADADNVEAETRESNNTLARLIAIGPDLVVSSVAVPVSAAPGGTVSVTDTIKNQGGGTADASTTRFYLSTNAVLDANDLLLTGSRSVPALSPGGVSTGSTTLLIPPSTTTGSYYLFAKADGDNSVSETQESNNSIARILQIGGDLVMSSLTVPAKGGAGSPLVVTDTTTNQGTAPLPPSITRFYLSNTATLDTSAVELPPGRSIPDLAPGVGSSGSTSVMVPGSVVPGNYYLVAKADADAAASETLESNNTAARQIAIGGDLVVSALTVPTLAGAGTTIVVADTTSNQGGGATGTSTTRFYLSTNSTLDGSDVPLSAARSVPSLAAGTTSIGSTSVMIPANTVAGSYYVIAKADADNTVPETQEGNNTAARTILIGGDLVVSALSVPATGGNGASIVITDTTTNQGTGSVSTSVTRFYLSANALLDPSDVLLPAGRVVPDLAAGASSAGSITVTLPSNLAVATYYIIARADGDNAVPESQESNNTAARAIAIGPDLSVVTLTVPWPVTAGGTASISTAVMNKGLDTAGGSTTRFYLSVDAVLDAGDVQLAGSQEVPVLAPGTSNSATTVVTIPPGTAAGYYYVIAVADADHTVAESQEGNNVALRLTQVTAGP